MRSKYRDPLHVSLEYIAKVSAAARVKLSLRDYIDSNMVGAAGTRLRYGPRSR